MNRKIAPPIVDAVNFQLKLPPYEKQVLDNGIPVYSINAGVEEVMMLEFVFFSGNCYEEKNLVAATTNFMLRNGTTAKSAFQLNEHFEYYGAFLNRACYNETATLTLHCLTKHISELLPVVQEILCDSVFPEEELAVYKQNQKQRLSVSLKKSDFVAGRLIDAYLFGDQHPYGKMTSFEAYDALNRDELIRFYNAYYKNGNCFLLAAGKLPDDLTGQLNAFFGRLPFGTDNSTPSNPVSNTEKPGKKNRIINDDGGVQGSIRLARPFPNRHHPDFQKALVLNTVLGGYFGSRLMTNIRENKGYTYGIQSYLQNHIQHSAWMISTETGRDVCEPAIEEIYFEMKRLREEAVSEIELLQVKNYMMGKLLGDLDGPFQVMARWKNYLLHKLDEKHFEEAIHTIKTISTFELQELANQYLKPEEFYELVVI